MSVSYQAVGWNRAKKIYDSVLAAGLLVYPGIFIGVGAAVHPNATSETLLIRVLGTAALLLLHMILCIGPLCRLDRRFQPLHLKDTVRAGQHQQPISSDLSGTHDFVPGKSHSVLKLTKASWLLL